MPAEGAQCAPAYFFSVFARERAMLAVVAPPARDKIEQTARRRETGDQEARRILFKNLLLIF
jgi:hypothetical protein